MHPVRDLGFSFELKKKVSFKQELDIAQEKIFLQKYIFKAY